MLYGIRDVACDVVGLPTNSDRLRPQEFWAVDDLSFTLRRGDTLGIVGPNGSGKSTLLKMLNGIIRPDKGRVSIRGKVGALIEVGAGFHPLLTGRENIYINGSILGMSKRELDQKFDSIVHFAEIGDFLDVPVKHYSSGMYVRLGFAVAAHCEPDILLVDEVLSVGDVAFQKKCLRFFEENVLEKGVTLILVSHSMYTIARMCSQALVLHGGKARFFGPSQDAVPEFYRLMNELSRTENLAVDVAGNLRSGVGEVRLQELRISDASGAPENDIQCGGHLALEMTLRAERDFKRIPNVIVQILDSSNTVLSNNTLPADLRPGLCLNKGVNILRCTFDAVSLMPGTYTISVKLGGGGDILQDLSPNAGTLKVTDRNAEVVRATLGAGLVFLRANWEMAGLCCGGSARS